MWDYEVNKPFIAIASHRFGAHKESFVDNFSQGGLSCKIDLDSGLLEKGVSFQYGGKKKYHDFHPVTGSKLIGVKIPQWEFVKDKILQIANSIAYIPYIGWDILITDKGFSIIEGNNYSNTRILQCHEPLLKKEPVINFYKKFGIIKNSKR